MDSQITLIYLVIVVACAGMLCIIYGLGVREKTYEEAIEEQRKLPDKLLLGKPLKDKNKDKKNKKANKKTDKKNENKIAPVKENSVPVVPVEAPPIPKVEISKNEKSTKKLNEKPKTVPIKENLQKKVVESQSNKPPQKGEPLIKRQNSKEKEKEVEVKANNAVLKENKSQPKEKVKKPEKQEVPKENKKTEVTIGLKKEGNEVKKEKGKNKSNNIPTVNENLKDDDKENKPKKQIVDEPMALKTQVQKASAPVQTEKLEAKVTSEKTSVKDRGKKKKGELSHLQKITGGVEGIDMNFLAPLVHKAELSHSEIQNLIDLLLNKQQNAKTSEWFEGRQDPVVKLKKQLAEKEKSLQEEQEAGQALHAKLKELRAEIISERSRMNHTNRQLEETLASKNSEVQGMLARMQSQQHEIQSLNQKGQQLQVKWNEEHTMLLELQKEKGQTQSVLQQELISQRQTLEMHIQRISKKHEENESALNTQLHQMHNKVKDQENINSSLNSELTERKKEINSFRDQIVHLESEGNKHMQDLAKRLEGEHRLELDRHLSSEQQRYGALQYELTALRKELDNAKDKCNEYANQILHLEEEKEKIGLASKEVRRLKEENESLMNQISMYVIEAQQLREDNESLAAQLTAETERPAAEGRENGDSQEVKVPENVGQIDKNSKLEEQNLMLEKISCELKQKDCMLDNLRVELNSYKTEIHSLHKDLESFTQKNNDLRTKNWKAMEALTATEKSLESQVRESQKQIDEIKKEICKEAKMVLQNIFPQLHVEEIQDYKLWMQKFESAAKIELEKSKTPVNSDDDLEKQNQQLQLLVNRYKNTLEETEGLLHNLQTHVEQEEAKWQQQLCAKEQELEAERKQANATKQIASKLEDLQKKLCLAEKQKSEVERQYQEVRLNCQQIQQEQAELRGQLNKEQERCRDLLAQQQSSPHSEPNELSKLSMPSLNHSETSPNGSELDGASAKNGSVKT